MSLSLITRLMGQFAIVAITLLLVISIGQTNANIDNQIHPLEVSEIAPGVFVSQGQIEVFSPANCGRISNIGFIIGKTAVAVIDTGGSLRTGKALKAAIRALTELPIRYVINTHMHPDHLLGNAAFLDDGTTFVGHHKLLRAVQARRQRYVQANAQLLGEKCFVGTRIVLPTVHVEDAMELDLGGRILHLKSHRTAHTDNDLTVFDKGTSTLWLGDLLFVRHVPVLDGNIKGWLATMDDLRTYEAARAVPGHGPASVPWPEALAPQRRYLSGLAEELRELIAQGRTLADATEIVGISKRDAWQLFEEFHARNIAAAFSELEWE